METFCKWQDEVIAGLKKIIGRRLTFQILSKVLQKGMSIVIVLLR